MFNTNKTIINKQENLFANFWINPRRYSCSNVVTFGATWRSGLRV